MAKSDSDSNGLRQDQPECPRHEARGTGGKLSEESIPLSKVHVVRRHTDRPSVTELPGLTSDSICTADRRGGILISFGPNRSPRRVINPPELVGPRARTVSNCPDRIAYLLPTADRPRRVESSVEAAESDPTSVLWCECPVILKGIGSGPPGTDTRQGRVRSSEPA